LPQGPDALANGSREGVCGLPPWHGAHRRSPLHAGRLSRRTYRYKRPWSFDGDGAAFSWPPRPRRIDLAFLFDPMMAVHTSNVEPLPHQITAVYESMLPRQPLRFVLADDPGAGKTIMAGLYIRELIMRADARRVSSSPRAAWSSSGATSCSRSSAWSFRIYSRELEAASPSGNPFEDHDHLIVRLDQLSRNDEYQEKPGSAPRAGTW
jgi:hypothetical protein